MGRCSTFARKAASAYLAKYGDYLGLPKKLPEPTGAKADRSHLKALADAWHWARHSPSDPMTRLHYDSLIAETVVQFEHAKGFGLKIEPFEGPIDQQPYYDVEAMIKDVDECHRLLVWPYAPDLQPDHPFAEKLPEADNLPAFIVFRGIHDAFAHCLGGHDILATVTGEVRAHVEHCHLYSARSRPALATELLGQVCWLFFGSHLLRQDGTFPKKGDVDYLGWVDRPYPEQKAVLLAPQFWVPANERQVLATMPTWEPRARLDFQDEGNRPSANGSFELFGV